MCLSGGNLAVYSAVASPVDELVLPDVLPAVEASGTDGSAAASPQAANVPLSSVPQLNSLPSASAKIYLNFTGDVTSSWGSYTPGFTPAYDTDGDATTFSNSELTSIQEIWERVSEKYSPFNINVTTVNPGNINNLQTIKVVIGGAGSWYGATAGGIAYVDSFSSANPTTGQNVVFVFAKNLAGGNAKFVAEAAAHEAGHSFGLEHQSVWSGGVKTSEYNQGESVRAPIMGTSYYATRGLWWNGTSSLPGGPLQDDMSVIARPTNGFGYRADDHGNTAATADPLVQNGANVTASGVISTTSDVDYFSFTATAGTVQFSVNPATFGGMLDATLELRDATGTLLATANTASLSETLSKDVTAGSYRLVVKSRGNYGDVGQYTVTGILSDNYENNDTRETAANLGVAPGIQLPSLNIDHPGDDDWFSFTLTAAASIDVSLLFSHSEGNLDLQVTNAAGTVILTGNSTDDNELAQLANLTAGTYYVRVYGVGGATNQYSLAILPGTLPLDLTPPKVTGVTLVGGGAAQTAYAVTVGNGEQLATVPVGRVTQIRVRFSEAVNVDQNDLVVRGTRVPIYSIASFGYDPFSNTAIWVLSEPIDSDRIALDLNADGASPVSDSAGNHLDGEWDNPAARSDVSSDTFPSGDGSAGGDFYFQLSVQPGDANRDGVVDGADYTAWSDHFLQSGNWGQGDFNDDAVVDGADYLVWSDHFLVALPENWPAAGGAGEPAPSAPALLTPASNGQTASLASVPVEGVDVSPVETGSSSVVTTAAAELPASESTLFQQSVAHFGTESAERGWPEFIAESAAAPNPIDRWAIRPAAAQQRLAAVDQLLSQGGSTATATSNAFSQRLSGDDLAELLFAARSADSIFAPTADWLAEIQASLATVQRSTRRAGDAFRVRPS